MPLKRSLVRSPISKISNSGGCAHRHNISLAHPTAVEPSFPQPLALLTREPMSSSFTLMRSAKMGGF